MSALDLVTLGLNQASGLSIGSRGLLVVEELPPEAGILATGRKVDVRLVVPGLSGLVLPKTDAELAVLDLEGDIGLERGDLVPELSLRTAILMSLFLDRRATEDEMAEFDLDVPGGWWGDAYPTVEGDAYGSKLWLLKRAKATNATRLRTIEYAREALEWLLEDEIAERVEVDAAYVRRGFLGLGVEIVKPANPSERFGFVWES